MLALATLDESNLNEPDGISASTPSGLTTVYGPVPPGPGFTAAGVPVDWNFDMDATDAGISSNINGGLACGATAAGEVLSGFDDWNVGFVFHTAGLVLEQSNDPMFPPFHAEQQQLRESELRISDVRQSRLVLLDGISFAIERIQVEPQIALVEEEFDTSNIAMLLQSDQLVEAIAELNTLRDQVIAGREVVPMIDNLVLALERQM